MTSPSKLQQFSIGIFCLVNSLQFCLASYCGESAIPFSFEVLPDGHPVLGCARPNCFGWDAFGQALRPNESSFYRINKQPDGFFRKALTSSSPKPLSDLEASWFKPQNATCSNSFKPGRCLAPTGGHWVGGIGPNPGHENSPLLLRCCKWAGLKGANDRGIATVRNGQIVYGGEVMDGDRQFAFDYISDINKVPVLGQNSPYYEVFIHRMACLPRPERLSAHVESAGVLKEMLHKFSLASESAQPLVNEEKQLIKNAKSVAAQLANQKLTSSSSKRRHQGESRIIKTSNWTPVENIESVPQEQQPEDEHVHLSGSGRPNKAFAASAPVGAIQGPFVENEIGPEEGAKDKDTDYVEETGQAEKHSEYGPQYGKQYIDGEATQPPNGQFQQQSFSYMAPNIASNINGPVMGTKKRLICDRNMTKSRAVRQAASCEEVEVEVPKNTEIEVENGQYYDPGQQYSWYQPSYWTYSYPSTGARTCFSGDTKVRRANGHVARMDQLAVGEWIYSTNESQLVYSIVESWIHRVPDQLANFVALHLADGRVLKLTEEHFIYKRSNCLANSYRADEPVPVEKIHAEAEMVHAKEVRPGDCLFGQRENSNLPLLFEWPVVSVGIVQERGIYAPMTGTGDILVEGLLASCYAVDSSPVLQKSVFNGWKSSSSQMINSLFGHNIEDQHLDLPVWLSFMVDHLMPFVLPK